MKSGYNYGKRKDVQVITKMFLGPGIVAVEGITVFLGFITVRFNALRR